jgi:CBS domain containing-hemolysin-like protein
MIVLLVILLLISINALYVAAEFAAVSVRRSRIQQLADEGNRLARLLLPILREGHRLDRYIAACQIGITISSLVLGAYGQAALAPVLTPLFLALGGAQEAAAQSAAAVTVLLSLTVVQMVVGELVPKSVALQFPTSIALYTVVPMRWSLRLLGWFISILNGSGLAILHVFGLREAPHRHIHSPDEIEYLIGESRKGGYFEAHEQQRLRQALRLTGRPVGEVMVPRTRIQAVPEDIGTDDLLRTIAESPYTRLPVYSGSLDEIIGLVHVEDVAVHRLNPGEHEPSVTDMLRPFTAVGEALSMERVLAHLRSERQHIAIVVDDFGGTAGLVTIGDLLDEIFGGVADEFKVAQPEAERLADGRVRLQGWVALGDAERYTGVVWTGDAYTVGGLVIERLEGFPEPGQKLRIDGVAVEVERMRGHVVESVLVEPALRRNGPWPA